MAADEVLLVAEHEYQRFEIQEGRGEGFYVFRFDREAKIPNRDSLQDTVEQAIEFAEEYWGVPRSAWTGLSVR